MAPLLVVDPDPATHADATVDAWLAADARALSRATDTTHWEAMILDGVAHLIRAHGVEAAGRYARSARALLRARRAELDDVAQDVWVARVDRARAEVERAAILVDPADSEARTAHHYRGRGGW